MIVQGLNHLASRDPSARAFSGHARKRAPEGLQLGDLLRHFGEMTFGYGVGFVAGAVGMIGEIQQGPDRIQVEAKLACMPDEGQPCSASSSYIRRSLAVRGGAGTSPICS